MDAELPISQAEARRRLRAAVAFAGLKSVESLGRPKTGYSKSVWRRIGISRDFKWRHAEAAVKACGLPDEWFTVPDLAEAVRLGATALRSRGEERQDAAAPDLPHRPTPRPHTDGQQQTG